MEAQKTAGEYEKLYEGKGLAAGLILLSAFTIGASCIAHQKISNKDLGPSISSLVQNDSLLSALKMPKLYDGK